MDDGRAVDRKLSAHSPTASLLGQLGEGKNNRIIAIHGLYSTWKLVTNEVLQKSVLRPVPFNICISSLEEEAERTLIQFADNIKLRRTVNALQDGAAVQRGLDRLDEWENRNLNESQRGQTHLVWTNLLDFCELGTDRLGCRSDGKDPGLPMANRPNVSQERAQAGRKANSTLGCINRSVVENFQRYRINVCHLSY